jgi:hypothetical protein
MPPAERADLDAPKENLTPAFATAQLWKGRNKLATKGLTSRIGLKHITPVLAAGAVAVAIAAAPTAAAASTGGGADQPSTQQYCVSSATSTKCQSPGDAEINSSIPAPYGGPWAIYGPFWGG